MAIYGVSFYGQDPYGMPTYVDFSVGDFIADPVDTDNIALSWTSPTGTWDRIRLVRNWFGFPVDENDGEILLDTDGAVASATDTTVRPGAWHYYAIWVSSEGTWYRAGLATTLMLADHAFGDRMFDSLPLYHRLLQGAVDDLPVLENTDLHTFLKVLGYGLDYIKTYYDSLRYLNDPMKNSAGQLLLLAQELGITYEPVAPPHLFRKRILNAGSLGREKGTLEQIRSVVSMTTGWDIDLSIGPNLMLNEDQASFVHPTYPQYSTAVNYVTGERVTSNGYIYQAASGAYGYDQRPSGTNASNAYWTWVNGNADTTLIQSDGTVVGWEALSFTAGVQPGTAAASIGVGVQSATDATVSSANTLLLSNNSPSATTADLGAHSAGGAGTDVTAPIRRGVPLVRRGPVWDAGTTYAPGDLVRLGQFNYRAKQQSVGVSPSGDTSDNGSWEALGIDERMQYTGSIYVKGGTGFQDRLAYPLLRLYDEYGNLQATVDTSISMSTNVFDPFSSGSSALTGRSTPVGSATWATQSGGWTVLTGSGVVIPTATGSIATITGAADGNVSATFYTSPGAGATQQGVVFRLSNATTYLKATRTGLYSVSSGTPTLLGTYSSAFADKDRISVSFTGSNITVARNGTTVLTVTSAFNSSSTTHGLLVA